MRAPVAVLGVWLALACAHAPDPTLTSGDILYQLGDTFTQLAPLMDKALDNKSITDDQYVAWAKFVEKFREIYPAAVRLWHACAVSQDQGALAKVTAIIQDLGNELTTFQILVGAPLVSAGAP